MKRIKAIVLTILMVMIVNINAVYAIEQPVVSAEAAILVEATTGRIVYSKNSSARMYPASMTKVLTALVMLDYIEPTDLVTVGYEINEIPADSSKAGHVYGEVITGENLVRGLIIPSGNETANVVAKNVARIYTGNENLSYQESEKIFMELMNKKAKDLGAVNSNFVTPHGYHDDNHYTTAEDMAKISAAAMKNDVIRKVAKEVSFEGDSAGEFKSDGMFTVYHKWLTHNLLIKPNNQYYYDYANGLKTGFTDQAGSCVAATAEKDGVELIAIIFKGDDSSRWIDAKTLFEYGFNNYAFRTVQSNDEIIKTLQLDNPPLADSAPLNIVTNKEAKVYTTQEEFDNIVFDITYNNEMLSQQLDEVGEPIVKVPIKSDIEVGTITYKLDNEVMYEGQLVSDREVEARTIKSDLKYYFDKVIDFVTSWKMIPTIIIFAVVAVMLTRFINKRRKKNRYKYKPNKKMKRRY